jgi:hypothetical protein
MGLKEFNAVRHSEEVPEEVEACQRQYGIAAM